MKLFADTNWIEALLGDAAKLKGQQLDRHRLAQAATQRHGVPLHLSALVLYEMEGVLWRHGLAREGLPRLQREIASGRLVVLPSAWEEQLAAGRDLQRRFNPRTRLGALDGLHLASAQMIRATHFCSFDSKSDLRACALSLGLRLEPEPAGEERKAAKELSRR